MRWIPAILIFCLVARPVHAASLLDTYRTGHLDLEEVFTVGGEDAPEDAILYSVSGMDVDADGFLYIADNKEHVIRVFGPDGAYVRTIGREGPGPGEFRSPGAVAVRHDGTIAVYDFGSHQIQILDREGVFIRSALYGEWLSYLVPLPNGEIIAMGQEPPKKFPPPEETVTKMVRLSAELEEIETIERFEAKTQIVITRGDSYSVTSAPFAPFLYCAASPNGHLVIGSSDRYRLRLMSADGAAITEFGRDTPPPDVTKDDREKVRAPYKDEALRDAITFPDHKSAFIGVYVDPENNILVRWADAPEDKSVFDVFNPDGEFVVRFETVELPQYFLRFTRSGVFARWAEYGDLPTVTRYRVVTQ